MANWGPESRTERQVSGTKADSITAFEPRRPSATCHVRGGGRPGGRRPRKLQGFRSRAGTANRTSGSGGPKPARPRSGRSFPIGDPRETSVCNRSSRLCPEPEALLDLLRAHYPLWPPQKSTSQLASHQAQVPRLGARSGSVTACWQQDRRGSCMAASARRRAVTAGQTSLAFVIQGNTLSQ